MGSLITGKVAVPGRLDDKPTPCTIEVIDQHSTPEVRIGPPDEAHRGWTASFEDWNQFEEFVEAVNDLHDRLGRIRRS